MGPMVLLLCCAVCQLRGNGCFLRCLISLQVCREEKGLQHRKHDEEFEQNNGPERAPQRHAAEPFQIKSHYPADKHTVIIDILAVMASI